MAHFDLIDPKNATGKARQLLDAVQAKLGITPNMTRAMANSPALLESYLAFSGTLAGGRLHAGLRERIALAVAEANGCEYCLSAHTAIGKMVGLNANDIAASRAAESSDPKIDAALQFTHKIVVQRGELGTADLDEIRAAGFTEEEVGEIIANVVLNIFTNYFNKIAATDVDFPKVQPSARVA